MKITEALAEIKTIDKRLEKRRAGVMGYIARQDGIKDPVREEGGSKEYIRRERQAIADLEQRALNLRTAINHANATTRVTVDGINNTVEEWLVWRRDLAHGQKRFLEQMLNTIERARADARNKGYNVTHDANADAKPTDYIINLDEVALHSEIERMETILGTLDGVLSMHNATTDVKLT